MKKFIKIFAIVIVVIIAALFILPVVFKGKIIQTIQDEANNTLNAELKFEDASLSLFRDFPNFSLKIEHLSLKGKDIFENDTLVAFNSLEAGLNLMSVISGDQIEINKLILDKAQIHAIVLRDGHANWDIMLPDTTAEEETAETDTTESTFALQLKKLEISESHIIYDDREGDIYAELLGFDFELSGDMTADVTDLKIKTLIKEMTVASEGIAYLDKVNTEFKGGIHADLAKSIYTFKENSLSLNKLVLNFDGSVAMPDTNIVLDLKFDAPDNDFKNALSLVPTIYQSDFEGMEASGSFNFKGYAKGTYNAVNMPGYGVDLKVDKARFAYPDLPKSAENITIDMNVTALEGSGDDMTVDIRKAHLEMAGNPFDARVYATMSAADTKAEGELNGKIDFNSLKDIVPLEDTEIKGLLETNMSFDAKLSDIDNEAYENVKAQGFFKLKNFSLIGPDYPEFLISTADMELSPQHMAVNQFDAQSGKSDFHLTGRVDNILNYVFSDDLLTGSFTFYSKYTDLDELAGTDTEESTGNDDEPENSPTSTTEAEVIRIPENIKFTLQSDIKRLLYDGMEITDIKGLISLDGGVASLNSIDMNALGGNIGMSGNYNSQPVKPLADFAFTLSGIDIQQVYKQFMSIQRLAPFAEYCNGRISGNMSLNTTLEADMMPDYSTLNSRGEIRSAAIGVKDNSVFSALSKATKMDAFSNPTLKDVQAEYEIKNGNLELKPTNFNIKDSDIEIAGTHNLDKTIDFRLNLNMPGKYAEKILNKLPENRNTPETIETEVKIGGTSDNPKITGISNNLTEGLKETVEEKIEEVKKDVKEEAQRIINEAQKKADAVIAAAEKQAANIRSEAKKAGDKLIREAEKQGDALIAKAGNNPIKKAAAKKSKEELVKTAHKKAKDLNNEADKQAKKVTGAAQKEADDIMEAARKNADSL